MQSRTKLLAGLATVTTIAIAVARRRRSSAAADPDRDEPTVAEAGTNRP